MGGERPDRGRGRQSRTTGRELAKYSFPEDEKKEYRQIPWDELARARDFYTHHYRDLDIERLRATVDGELRELLRVLGELDLPEFADS